MSPQCAVCKNETTDGLSFPIYLGRIVDQSTTHKYGDFFEGMTKAIFDPLPRFVFICYPCLLKPALKSARTLMVCSFLLIPTVLFTIPGIIFVIVFNNATKKINNVITAEDPDSRSAYLLKEKEKISAYGEQLALKTVKSDVKASGQKYDLVLTPAEHASWHRLF